MNSKDEITAAIMQVLQDELEQEPKKELHQRGGNLNQVN